MAYAEKHGRGYRARWRDTVGSLRSASGFLSREEAEEYGKAHEGTMGREPDNPWRLLANLADRAGGELWLYAGEVDALPTDVRVEVKRETVTTGSRPDGYQMIVLRVVNPAGDGSKGD